MITTDSLLLQHVPCFRDLPSEDLALVAGQTRRRTFSAGEIVLLEGQPAEALYLVCGGRVRVFRSTSEGREQVLYMAGPGDTFNDVAAFDGGANLANAQAIDSSTCVCLVPVSMLVRLLAHNPRIAARVVTMLARRTRQLAALVEDVSLHPTTQRVARFLEDEAGASATVVVNRQELAARIGSVREVVSRTLRHLEQVGAVTRQDARTLRINAPLLHAFADPAAPISRSHAVTAR